MAFTTVVSLAFAKKTPSKAKDHARKLTYDSCILTIRTPVIPDQRTSTVKRVTTFSY